MNRKIFFGPQILYNSVYLCLLCLSFRKSKSQGAQYLFLRLEILYNSVSLFVMLSVCRSQSQGILAFHIYGSLFDYRLLLHLSLSINQLIHPSKKVNFFSSNNFSLQYSIFAYGKSHFFYRYMCSKTDERMLKSLLHLRNYTELYVLFIPITGCSTFN